MAKKDENINPLMGAIQELKNIAAGTPIIEEKKVEKEKEIVDIITFCEDPRFLGFYGTGPETEAIKKYDPTAPQTEEIKIELPKDEDLEFAEPSTPGLYFTQRIILKCFYAGTIGNETLALDQKEWEWLYSHEGNEIADEIEYENSIKDVIRKMHQRMKDSKAPYFKELHLALGRRSSKTFMASIITAYEAYKLLVINKGNPHAYYKLPNDDEIAIINVALSEKQAGRLFAQIQSRIRNSPFFKDRIGKGNASEIRLLTDSDIAKKKDGAQLDVYGSVIMLCGHSNPDSLAGYSAILILFDEIAFYDESGKVTGTYFYKRLKPSLAKFYKYGAARIIQISSPNTRSGIFYDTWNLAKTDDSILSFQLPCWDVCPDVPYDNAEMKRERESNLDMFKVEYGAQWAETGTFSKYFHDDSVIDRCIRGDIGPHRRPMPNFNYYLHVDPAKKKNQYAAVLVAKERYAIRGQKRSRCYLAGLWVWKPVQGQGLLFGEIDKDILGICNLFRPMSVTYDAYNSVQSLQFLRSHGVPTKELPFNNSTKAKVYQNLRDMMSFQPNPEIYLYSDGGLSDILIAELKNLKMRQTKRGYSIIPDKNAEVNTDDLCVHPDTIVFSDIPKQIKDINIGEEVLTHDGTYHKVINKLEHNKFNRILKISPNYGLPLIATDNHPIEVLNSNGREWKQIKDISINEDMALRSFETKEIPFKIDLNDYMLENVPNHCHIKNYINETQIRDRNANAKWHNRTIESNYDFGYICGLYLSEGSISDHSVSIAANINEKNIHEKFSNAVIKIFGFKDSGHKQNKTSLGSQTHINSQIIKRLFLDLFQGKTAGEKFIPRFMMSSNIEFQKGLICGMFDGDGSIRSNKKSFIYTTTSRGMAIQLSSLLLKFGIMVTRTPGRFYLRV